MHRFIWDLRYPPWLTQAPDALNHEYPISAIYGDTPREPLGTLVLPGQYSVKLTKAGRPDTQPLAVKNGSPGGDLSSGTAATIRPGHEDRRMDALGLHRAPTGPRAAVPTENLASACTRYVGECH